MRTFIAVELPPAHKERLHALQDALRTRLDAEGLGRKLSWTGGDKFHLTLRFLGETKEDQGRQVAAALAQIAAQTAPFSLALGQVGAFPNWRRMRVVWVGVEGETDQLARMQQSVEQAVQACGFQAEAKTFLGHITLARVRRGPSPKDVQRMAEIIQAALEEGDGKWPALPWMVREMVWMRSELHPRGARYTPLGRYRLGSEEDA